MSYNVTSWTTKEMKDFRVPLDAFYKCERRDWHPDRENADDGTVRLSVIETVIEGRIVGDWFHVEGLHLSGEGSGTALDWIWEPAFRHSKGRLVAARVWEGGDHIDRLIVDDGELTKEEIEL